MNRLLDKEWFLKILALFLAIGLWASVHPGWRLTVTRSFLVPLQTWGATVQDKMVRMPNEKVRLQVSVPSGREVSPAGLAVGVTVAGLSPGWHRLKVETHLPVGVQLEAVVPAEVRVLVLNLGRRTIAVTAVPVGQVPPGLAWRGLLVRPDRVEFWGLPGDLGRVNRIQLVFKPPVVAGAFRVEGPLSARDDRDQVLPGIRLGNLTATVSGEAYALSQVTLPVLARTAGLVPAGFTVTALQVAPPVLSVLPGSVALPPNLETEPVPLAGKTSTFTMKVPVVVPPRAAFPADGAVTVTVSIAATGG